MKKMWMLILVVALVVGSVGLYGCSKNDSDTPPTADDVKAPDTGAVEKTMDEAKDKAAELPAAEKPKDHPAH